MVRHYAALAIAAMALGLGGGACAGAPPRPMLDATAPSGGRYIHKPDLPVMLKAFLSPQGFMDPAFPPTIAHASPYLSDFFGLQAIADVTREQILADFVPSDAAVSAEDAHSVTLTFKEGFTAKFYPQASLDVMGIVVPVAHVEFAGDDWRTRRGYLARFLALLERKGLAPRYLIPNPSFADERIVERAMGTGRAAKVDVDPDLSEFDRGPRAVLLMPESVHGVPDDADRLTKILRAHKVSWIGMEMLSPAQQPLLDAYFRAKPGSADFLRARKGLVDYFAGAWNGRAGPKTTGEENYYFKLVEAARLSGARVIGMEQTSIDYLFFRFGETPFGGAVRSYWWSKLVPVRGRGVLFGGKAHFSMTGAINVQDFVAAHDPGRTFVSLIDLKRK